MSDFELHNHRNGVVCHVTPDLTIPDKLAGNKRHAPLRNIIILKERRKQLRLPGSYRTKVSNRVVIDEGGISLAYETTPDPSNDHCFYNYGPDQQTGHGFLQAAVTAFCEHYPFIIRPQHIWIMILQVVAEHVNRNSVELRSKWMLPSLEAASSSTNTEGQQGKPEGESHNVSSKINLIAERNDFVFGSKNDWASVVMRTNHESDGNGKEDDSFIKQIQNHTLDGVLDEVMLGDMLSGTTDIEKITMGITVMDALQTYFEYIAYSLCGFPSITLEGTLSDWQLIRLKAEQLIRDRCLSSFADKWLLALLPVLDKFVSEYTAASTPDSTTVDTIFWNSMIRRGGKHGSGGFSFFNGWINIFFPYLKENEENEYAYVRYEESLFSIPAPVKKEKEDEEEEDDDDDDDDYHDYNMYDQPMRGQDCNTYPEGLSSVPVTWLYYDETIPLEFRSGFVCAKQDPITKAIMPAMAWYITCDWQTYQGIKERKGKGCS